MEIYLYVRVENFYKSTNSCVLKFDKLERYIPVNVLVECGINSQFCLIYG